mmetsp:Transcript_6955/g.10626  ORF Transcript_6955/g.10626 Transcript_6955/m.10626 type:complete len:446 (-) Transcript_6955:7-1344(-)
MTHFVKRLSTRLNAFSNTHKLTNLLVIVFDVLSPISKTKKLIKRTASVSSEFFSIFSSSSSTRESSTTPSSLPAALQISRITSSTTDDKNQFMSTSLHRQGSALRDRKYFLAYKQLVSGIADLSVFSSKLNTEPLSAPKVLSGASDPVLVESRFIANAYTKRITFFFRLTNVTTMLLQNISVLICPIGQLEYTSATTVEHVRRIQTLGFQKHWECALALNVRGMCFNGVKLTVLFDQQSDHLRDGRWTIGGNPTIHCKPFAPLLSTFMYRVKFEVKEYVQLWTQLPYSSSYNIDLAPSITPDNLVQLMLSTTSFSRVIDSLSIQTTPKGTLTNNQRRQIGLASLSWFADQFQVLFLCEYAASRGAWCVKAKVKASSVRVGRSFALSFEKWLYDYLVQKAACTFHRTTHDLDNFQIEQLLEFLSKRHAVSNAWLTHVPRSPRTTKN